MSDLPFEVPSEIDGSCREYDDGFLAKVLSGLRDGEVISGLDDVVAVVGKLGEEHNRLMLYHEHCVGKWTPSNYAYEDVSFNSRKSCLEGVHYHVTGLDGTRSDGDRDVFMCLREGERSGVMSWFGKSRKHFVVSKMLLGELKGVVVAQEYGVGVGGYDISMVLGDRYGKVAMPYFRGVREKICGQIEKPLIYRGSVEESKDEVL